MFLYKERIVISFSFYTSGNNNDHGEKKYFITFYAKEFILILHELM